MSLEHHTFDHIYIDHGADRTLVLLPGTGGDKTDLLFFDELVKHSFNILSLQGNVNEGGLLRFFRRDEFGIFDQASIDQETTKLNAFILKLSGEHSWKPQHITLLGYSNGANMTLAMLLRYPKIFNTALLLHPMMPFPSPEDLNLHDHKVFVSIGSRDVVIPPDKGREVAEVLSNKGAELSLKDYPGGHEVTQQELTDVAAYLLK